jgi:hypothetical protein
MADSETDGLVKVHMRVNDDDFKIFGESVWAKPLGHDLYEIRNTPWHTCDVNWGDIVRAVPENENQKPEFREVVRRGGHRTLHILFFKELGEQDRTRVLARLKDWKASYENRDGSLYAVDVEPDGDFDGLCAYLDGLGEEAGIDYRTLVSSAEGDSLDKVH